MNRIKKLKKIRIHHEGTNILITSALVLVAVNLAFCYLIDNKIPFYILATVSVVLYLLMVNFFRCPIRLFKGETEKTVVALADGRIVVIEEVDEHEYFHDKRNGFSNGEKIEINSKAEIQSVVKQYNIQKGDLMYFKNKDGSVHHATIISDVIDNKIFYSGNTKRRYDQPLDKSFGDGVYIVHMYDYFVSN